MSLPSSPIRTEPRPADRDHVAALTHSTGFFREEEIAVAVELVDERLANGINSGYHFAFLDSDQTVDAPLAGYAAFGPVPCSTWSHDLYWIAVDPRYQGRGYGRTLVEHCEQEIRKLGGRRVYIETSSQDRYRPTQIFYERLGYKLEATLADFYGPNDSKLIYSRTLEPFTVECSQNPVGRTSGPSPLTD